MARSMHKSNSRRGTSRNNRSERLASEKLKGGTRTYFFDIKEAKSGRPYLVVTETRFDKGSGQMERSSIFCYSEDVREFHKLFQSMTRKLLQFAEDSERAPRQQSIDDVSRRPAKRRSYDADFDDEEEDDEDL